ncbi:MAG: hypothetical protein LBG18_02380 [Mediterranea sp.]|jgi:hypothetical protein|nr:hypothetical protein [Mediterranea sp.]
MRHRNFQFSTFNFQFNKRFVCIFQKYVFTLHPQFKKHAEKKKTILRKRKDKPMKLTKKSASQTAKGKKRAEQAQRDTKGRFLTSDHPAGYPARHPAGVQPIYNN